MFQRNENSFIAFIWHKNNINNTKMVYSRMYHWYNSGIDFCFLISPPISLPLFDPGTEFFS
ncbi:MAG: hypothetical protein BGO32_04210 [Bacteroidetes bacterium 37-13]|nr:MAG: hypothetical protein BGO32_04210 [Bacteroidetes bacterium 37-13]